MAQKTQTFETRIDLSEKTRTAMVKLLNQQLADTFDLYSQIKQSHWNEGHRLHPAPRALDDSQRRGIY